MTRQFTQNGLTVPYIAAWSSEKTVSPLVERREAKGGPCLAYRDESPYDRDMWGALWIRQAIGRGKGRANFAAVHALRQRQAMIRLLCQVCGTDILAQSPERQLFVLKDTGQPVTEGETTTAPPLCLPCALVSVRDCPHLRTGHVAAWVGRPQVWGVAGVVYDPTTLRPVSPPANRPTAEIAYDDPAIRWTLAARHVNVLHDVTPVQLSDLVAEAGQPAPGRTADHP
ncbi:hypothetical protein HW130_32350 [Streptomyces sp. PKU-EA00015]|uniref:hypothetical protein n=1 Tax=Streptomyces sp. PKU-EA00015 TaxID=2748326 RepID=UPI0015A1D003|nr:hypothetical protein [Streptomyces sp. PKU-EA00015]NWF30884.1 hypothetical protein [Streptomyces sp. PKU-EA00015]